MTFFSYHDIEKAYAALCDLPSPISDVYTIEESSLGSLSGFPK